MDEQARRYKLTKEALMRIMYKKGVIPTLGLLMGIIARRSQNDWDLFDEIIRREEQISNDS